MEEDIAAKILGKHLLKFIKMAPNYFADSVDKEKFAQWLASKCVEEGWVKITNENMRETLHPLTISMRYLGGKAEADKTVDVLPKGSKIAILKTPKITV